MNVMNSTTTDHESLERWRTDEKTWWEKHSDVMTYQWKLTPELNKIVRQELESDYNAYLLKTGGRLLDLGCGSGWLAMSFAEKGMSVLGIDFAQEQIDAAEKLKHEKGLPSVSFECSDLARWDCSKHVGEFDSIFVNAFLHHLPSCEIEAIMGKISLVLKPGGRAYFYEPLTSASAKKSFFSALLDFLVNGVLGVFIGRLPRWGGLWSKRYRESMGNGYSGASPHERPLDIDWMIENCFKSLKIIEIKCWHLYSLGFAMQAMMLKEPMRSFYFRFVPLLCWVDKVVLSLYPWRRFASPGRFILCSIKLEKAP